MFYRDWPLSKFHAMTRKLYVVVFRSPSAKRVMRRVEMSTVLAAPSRTKSAITMPTACDSLKPRPLSALRGQAIWGLLDRDVLGEGLRLGDWQIVFEQSFDMHANSLVHVLLGLFPRVTCCDTAWQVGRVGLV